ncbi:tail fiber domain-containing protein [Citrobacter sp. CK180]|uniref:tail fiber domain-containing protein n=1 Tax=Citrobacter sp. CK180 TaxID=2985089 RepID=UPI002576B414|nr:tail fiber domain-containing protein [Citrobacter sp. CK180]MDM3063455.1 tail fiber domain-containing protein [Citrobacter sp. CK180]
MPSSLTGMKLNDAYALTAFKYVIDSSSYKINFGNGNSSPMSVYNNTAIFSTASPEVVYPQIASGYGPNTRLLAHSGSFAAIGAMTASTSSASVDRARAFLQTSSQKALDASLKTKASLLAELRKDITSTSTTVTGNLALAAVTDEGGGTEDRPFEFTTFYDATTPANSYKSVKLGGGALSSVNGTQLELKIMQDSTGTLTYNQDGRVSLGTVPLRFTQVCAQNGTIQTSDRTNKMYIQEIPDDVLDAWDSVPVRMYKMKDAVAEKGDAARWHFGKIAQDIEEAFKAAGLDPFAYGVLCYDEWDDIKDVDGNIIAKAGNRYSVRYDEAAQLDAACLHRKMERL